MLQYIVCSFYEKTEANIMLNYLFYPVLGEIEAFLCLHFNLRLIFRTWNTWTKHQEKHAFWHDFQQRPSMFLCRKCNLSWLSLQPGRCPWLCPPGRPWWPPALPPWRRAPRCPPAPQPGTTARPHLAGETQLLILQHITITMLVSHSFKTFLLICA